MSRSIDGGGKESPLSPYLAGGEMPPTPRLRADIEDDAGDVGVTVSGSLHGTESEPVVREGPAGMGDPETLWDYGEKPAPLPHLGPDQYLVILPGAELIVADGLPKVRKLHIAVVAGHGELYLCDGRKTGSYVTPNGLQPEDGEPVATHMTIAWIARASRSLRHASQGNLAYIVLTDDEGEMIGWLEDDSDWGLDVRRLEQVAKMLGLQPTLERFASKPDFEAAHPDWVG